MGVSGEFSYTLIFRVVDAVMAEFSRGAYVSCELPPRA